MGTMLQNVIHELREGSMSKRTVTVTSVQGDTIDVTSLQGLPTVIVGDWVDVSATDGQVTVNRRMRLDDQPCVGQRFDVEIKETA